MRCPRNTTRDVAERPEVALVEAMVRGPSGSIEHQEAQGQRELVASTVLPVEGSENAELAALGIVFGPVVPGDPIFREATLPPGWRKVPSEHPMWSHIVDEHGEERVAVFYKAAFYDRRAQIHVCKRESSDAR